MAGKHPEEVREDVVAVAKNRTAGVSLKQIATDFGISYATLTNWMRQDATDAGEREGRTSDEKDALRELRRRNRSGMFQRDGITSSRVHPKIGTTGRQSLASRAPAGRPAVRRMRPAVPPHRDRPEGAPRSPSIRRRCRT